MSHNILNSSIYTYLTTYLNNLPRQLSVTKPVTRHNDELVEQVSILSYSVKTADCSNSHLQQSCATVHKAGVAMLQSAGCSTQ